MLYSIWAFFILATAIFLMAVYFLYTLAMDTKGKTRYAAFKKNSVARETLRTPDACFEGIPDYPFTPHYQEINGLRMHYVDEGPRDGKIVLLLHGEPSWSFLYRKVIPQLSSAGFRVIAPDLIGFGKSDKLLRQDDYSYQMHIDMVSDLLKVLDLNNMILFCQDWGGLIGLRVAIENEGRFAGIITANTGLPGKEPRGKFQPVTHIKRSAWEGISAFLIWLLYSQLTPKLEPGKVLQMGTIVKLMREEVAAYNAPYPERCYLAGARKFPRIVLSEWENNSKAWEKLAKWEKPFLTAFGDKDPILSGGDRLFQSIVPGAQGQPHEIIRKASHFLQEDAPNDVARAIISFANKL